MTPRGWLRLALFCSLAPLAVGVSIFLVWLPTHWNFLAVGGLLNITFGSLLFPIGILATWIHHRKATDDPLLTRKTGFAVGLLLLNFSTAFSIMMAAARLGSECVVILDNKSDASIDRYTVMAGGPMGGAIDVPPRASRTLRFRVNGDVSVAYTLVWNGKPRIGDIAGWTDQGMGGDWRVTLLPDGGVVVEDLREPFRPGVLAK